MDIRFQKIDSEICGFSDTIIEIANDLQFEEVCEFKPGESLCSNSWDLLSCSGVYLIEIKTDGIFENFKSWAENFKLE